MLSFTVIVGLASAFGESLKPVKPLAMSMLQLKKEKSSSIVANTEKVEIPGRVASGRASSLKICAKSNTWMHPLWRLVLNKGTANKSFLCAS